MLACILPLVLPKFDFRWVYVMTNLQVVKNADSVCELIDRAKKAGYNGLVLSDSKLQRLGEVPDFYFANARKVIDKARSAGIEIIPCVWPMGYASPMLSHDVNLIEGLPAKQVRFRVAGQSAQLVSTVSLPNGNLESATDNRVASLRFQDGPGQSTFVDREVKHGGDRSIRLQDFHKGNEAGNARLVWSIKVEPFHPYILSGWTRREGLKGQIQAIALNAKGRNLVVQEMDPAPTKDWTQFRFAFNSLDASEVNIYCGVWGGTAGKMWWDDIELQDAGLLNLIRRPGCPIRVATANGKILLEGRDFKPLRDPGLGKKPWDGEYDLDHPTPTLELLPAAGLKDGDTVDVDFYHAKTGIGNQAAICMSEPKTREILEDEAKRVVQLFQPKSLFWSHDEIRVGGWCAACQARRITPGGILANNARDCGAIQQKLLPGSVPYVWSDMFDPTHNAVDNYYLTNGTLAESWQGLPKNAVIVNWNFGQRRKSLPFFSGRGHRQILAGYYDGPVENIRHWLDDAKGIDGISGVMYTTWVNRYDDLEAFAKAAWGG